MKTVFLSRACLKSFLLPLALPGLATVAAVMLLPWLSVASLALLYLAAVLLTAVSTGVTSALVAAGISFLAYNFFLTEPYYSLRMLHHEDILTGLLLVLVAVVTGHMAARLSEQVSALRESEKWNAQQMACARALAVCVSAQDVIKIFSSQLQDALGWYARTADTGLVHDAKQSLPRDVSWHEDNAGVTLLFSDGKSAAVGCIRLSATEPLTTRHRQRLEVLVSLARLAWGRVQLAESLRDETLGKEREQLRSALLSSVSHDLRTPLATMIGSVSSLIDLSDSLEASERAELLDNTLTEARRLDRYIQKLLDMTRLGHGELTLDRDWIGLDDIVSVVLRRCKPLLGDLDLKLDVPPDLPLLHVHPALIEQALFNVLENAIRFSPAGGRIWLSVEEEEHWLHVDVRDSGPGIAADKREQVFDMFHTFSHGDQYAAGTGLGLAICRGILAAHGGQVVVLESAEGKGATVRLSLPVPARIGGLDEAV
ncbi:MAG: hypothetical protein CVV16_03735 [Gammaproteobacteria bacterium HGW-Gammaproteobacteria-6]|nr:MAG: hypothetical protein CVV16_03735 [Gammaproteobacteria bacterium HGW-Gammaproteobacteria-6]